MRPQPYINQSVFKSLLNCTSEMSLSRNAAGRELQRDGPSWWVGKLVLIHVYGFEYQHGNPERHSRASEAGGPGWRLTRASEMWSEKRYAVNEPCVLLRLSFYRRQLTHTEYKDVRQNVLVYIKNIVILCRALWSRGGVISSTTSRAMLATARPSCF